MTLKPDEIFTNVAVHRIAGIIKTHRDARTRVGKPTEKNRVTFETAKTNGGRRMWVNGRRRALRRSARYPPEFTLALSARGRRGLSSHAAEAARAV